MKPIELGNKLKKARELSGLSQLEVAEFLSIPRTAVTQMEGGNRSVSTLELAKLSTLLHKPISYFFEPDSEDEDVLVTLYRIAPGIVQEPDLKKQLSTYLEWCRTGFDLEVLLGYDQRVGPPTYEEPIPKSNADAIRQGLRVADHERMRLNLGYSPILDMAELINTQNIWASGVPLPDSNSGVFLSHPSIGMAIFVNLNHARTRKRFSYAHEYAHALLDRNKKVTVSAVENASDLIEKRANAFAAAFLMPAEGVVNFLENMNKGRSSKEEFMVFDVATDYKIDASSRSNANHQRITYIDVAALAYHFKVSYQAATYRLRSLNHISANECDLLLEKYPSGRDYLQVLHLLDDSEGTEISITSNRELRSHVLNLALEAFRREEISRGKLLEIGKSLDIDASKLLSLANDAMEC